MKTVYYVEWRDGRKWKQLGGPETNKANAIRICRDRESYRDFNSSYRVVCVVTEELLRETVYETKRVKR